MTRLKNLFSGTSLQARASRSSAITILGYGTEQALRLVSNVVLAALLYPEAFGIMAIATVVMIGLNMVSDSGIHHAIIQNKKGAEQEFRNTAWTLQIYRGFIIWAIACIAAYPLSRLYEEAVLFPVICVLGFTEVIRGFQTTAMSVHAKDLNLAKVALVKVGIQLLNIVFMVIWALIDPTLWALVGGGIFANLVGMPLAHRFLNGSFKHEFKIDRKSFIDLFNFGKWIFLSSIVGFVGNYSDRMVVGKVFEMADLGLYSIAYALAYVPWVVFNKLGRDVLMPIYSKVQDRDIADIRRQLFKIRSYIAALLLPPTLFLMMFGKEVIELIYDDRYLQAGWMLEVLAFGVAVTVATNIGPIYLGLGKPKMLLLVTVFKAIFLLSSMLAGYHYFGAPGLVVGVALSQFLNYLFLIGIYVHFKLWIWKLDAFFLAIIAICSAISFPNVFGSFM